MKFSSASGAIFLGALISVTAVLAAPVPNDERNAVANPTTITTSPALVPRTKKGKNTLDGIEIDDNAMAQYEAARARLAKLEEAEDKAAEKIEADLKSGKIKEPEADAKYEEYLDQFMKMQKEEKKEEKTMEEVLKKGRKGGRASA